MNSTQHPVIHFVRLKRSYQNLALSGMELLLLGILHSHLLFSATLSLIDLCENNEYFYLSEMDGGKNLIIHDFYQF